MLKPESRNLRPITSLHGRTVVPCYLEPGCGVRRISPAGGLGIANSAASGGNSTDNAGRCQEDKLPGRPRRASLPYFRKANVMGPDSADLVG